MWLWMWKREVSLRCSSSGIFHFLLLKRQLLLRAGQWAPRDPPVSASPAWRTIHKFWGLNSGPHYCVQELFWLSHPPSVHGFVIFLQFSYRFLEFVIFIYLDFVITCALHMQIPILWLTFCLLIMPGHRGPCTLYHWATDMLSLLLASSNKSIEWHTHLAKRDTLGSLIKALFKLRCRYSPRLSPQASRLSSHSGQQFTWDSLLCLV